MEKLRTFIAIELPDELKKRLEMLQEELKKDSGKASKISWARPETIHLTLKFLGPVENQRLEEISEALKKATRDIEKFTVKTRGIGGFPNLKNPRVVWVGMDGSEYLKKLYGNIEECMESAGFEREKREFHPHLTLCRVKNPKDGKMLSERIEKLRTDISMDFQADSVVFFKSELKKGGAVHTELTRAAFKN